MQIDWLTVIGLVLIIEGMGPLLFPNAWRSYLQKLATEPTSVVRQVGAFLFAIGVILLWLR